MNQDIKKLIIEVIKDQQNVFGDDLLETISFAKNLQNNTNLETNYTFNVAAKTKKTVDDNIIVENFDKITSVKEFYTKIHTCLKCDLGKTRTKFVFGKGNENADIMLVGEAPGAEEDKHGEPFVGRAGKLLTDILTAIKLTREEVFIANVLKCRPPNNRDPLPSEISTCKPYLEKQIDLIKPKAILCLGRFAANTLLEKKESLTELRDHVYEYKGVKVMVTYHPAALLRNPNWKRGCWEDVKKFKKMYDELNKS